MAEDRQPKLILAAFGKHPGWDDHIDDIGLTTNDLAEVKRRLYTIGVRENLDRGEWDQLPPEGRLEGFKHVFIWSIGRSILVGRLWSSRDGKGRGRYPMVVCAQCSNQLPLNWILEQVLPRLKAIEEACTATTAREQVQKAIEQHQAELRLALTSVPPAASFAAPAGALAALADQEELGPNHQGLHRLLYQIERSWAEYCVGGLTKGDEPSTWSMTLAASVLRAPSCGNIPGAVLKLWFDFLTATLSPGVPAVVLYRLDQHYVDLMAGQPSAQEFRALCTTPAALPLTTEIPYSVDADFIANAAAAIEASRRGDTAPAAAPTGGNGPQGPGAIKSLLGRIMGFGRKKMIWLLLLGAVAMIAAGLAYVAKNADTIFPATQPRPAPLAAAEDRPFTSEDAARWKTLCDEYFQWFGIFDSQLAQQRPALEADPHLNAILALLDQARRDGVPLSPRQIGDAAGDTISHLTAEPPPRAKTQKGVDETKNAIDIIAQVRGRLATWPRHADLQRWAAAFESRGWAGRAAAIKSIDPVDLMVSSSLAAALGQLTARHDQIKPFAGPLEELAPLLGEIEKAGAGTVLAGFSRRVAADLAPAKDETQANVNWPRLSQRAAELLIEAQRAAAFLKGPWDDQVDRTLAMKDPALPAVKADEAPTIEQLRQFLTVAGGYRRLAKDPRPPRGEWDARLDPINRRLNVPQATQPVYAEQKILRNELINKIKDLYELPPLVRHEAAIKSLHDDCQRRLNELSSVVLGDAKKWLAEVRKPLGLSSPALDDFSQRQVAALIGAQTAEDLEKDYTRWYTLRESLESTRKLLQAVDKSLAPAAAAPAEAPRWAGELAQAALARREKAAKAAADVVKQGQAEKLAPDAILARWKVDADRHKMWQNEAGQVIAGLRELEAALDKACTLDDDTGQAKLREQVAAVRALPVLADLKNDTGEAVAVVMSRVEGLETMAKATDAMAIAKTAAEAGKDRPELLLAGWQALGKLKDANWPADLPQWTRESELVKQLAQAADRLPDERRAAIRQEIQTESPRRWAVCFEQLKTPGDIDKAAADPVAAVAGLDSLSQRSQFNFLLHQMRHQPRPKDEAELRQQLMAFHQVLANRFSRRVDDVDVDEFIGEIKKLTIEDNTQPSKEIETAGPGSAAAGSGAPGSGAQPWQAKLLAEDGSRVEYRRGESKLTFVLIDSDKSEPPCYLLDTEVSVAVFAEAMGERVAELKGVQQIVEDERDLLGPCGWMWHSNGKQLLASKRWLPAGFGYAPGLATRPGDQHPMQYVSPAAALLAARQLGCRLPTAAQWRSARDQFAAASAKPNLRDATWLAQWKYINDLPKDKPTFRWPDAGAFWPRGAAKAEADKAPPPADPAFNDGHLFTQPVDEPADAKMRHLMGNVAEYVFDHPDKADAVKTVQECISLVAGSDAFRVIGGSALSPPSIKADEPQLIDWAAAGKGFADVGFRLAFPAPRVPLAKRLQRVLEAQAYLVKP